MSSTESETKTKTFKGSCHCGAVQYTATAPLSPDNTLSAIRCNCTFCTKLKSTNLRLVPGTFQLLKPASKDDEVLGAYMPRVKTLPRYYCKECGTHVWMDGYFEMGGQRNVLLSVDAATIDQPQEGIDIRDIKINYFGGLNDFKDGFAPDEHPKAHGLK